MTGGIVYYEYASAQRSATTAAAFLALVAIIVPIWALAAVSLKAPASVAPWIQLTIMTVFAVFFVSLLIFLMNMKRTELFATTAT